MFKPFRSIVGLRLLLQFQPFKTRSSPEEATEGAWGRQQSCHHLITMGCSSWQSRSTDTSQGFLYMPQKVLLPRQKVRQTNPYPTSSVHVLQTPITIYFKANRKHSVAEHNSKRSEKFHLYTGCWKKPRGSKKMC